MYQYQRAYTMTATRYASAATAYSSENVKNCILLRNRQNHGEFTVIQSSENMFVAIMVIVCGRHCRTPLLHIINYN